jgi:membrane protein implicated in regulation of membrane protease activity
VDDWLIWLIVGVACLALETMTLSFVVSYFGIGALAASAAALLGAPVGGQVAVFAIVALVLLLFTRRVIVDLVQGRKAVVTNVHSLIGRGAIVTIPISNDQSTGQIRIGTEYWTARVAEDDRVVIPAGARVEVVEVVGVTARVRLRDGAPLLAEGAADQPA